MRASMRLAAAAATLALPGLVIVRGFDAVIHINIRPD